MSVTNVGGFGRQVTYATGNMTQIIAEAAGNIRWKTGAMTMDWNTVPAVAADTTFADGNTVRAGTKGVIYGTVFTKITSGATTGYYGPFTSAAPAATTTNGATIVGATQTVLTSAATLFPGDLMTLDAGGNLETARIASISGNTVTWAAPLAIAHASGVAASKVNDGRAVLTPGECFVINQTILQTPGGTIAAFATNYPAGLFGGKVWAQRLQVGGTNQPTLAQLLAACPMLFPVEMA